jgi:hypothetical protein
VVAGGGAAVTAQEGAGCGGEGHGIRRGRARDAAEGLGGGAGVGRRGSKAGRVVAGGRATVSD